MFKQKILSIQSKANILKSERVDSKKIQQQGSALLLALFIIIVLTLLGGALMRVLSTGSESIAQEVLGTRAYSAANSAIQSELQKLFPLNDAAPICNLNFSYNFSSSGANINGLYHCEAKTSCDAYATHPIDGSQFYRLTSTGKCGSSALSSQSLDIVVSSRTIQIEARTL